MATKTIEKRKKTKKEKDIFVCVHVRRTDRINFEKAHGLKPLKGKFQMIKKITYRKFPNRSRGLYFFFAIFSAAYIRERLLNESGFY